MNEITCRIDSLSYGAAGIARTPEGVVFVPNTVPGDVVRARVVRVWKRHREAELVALEKPSPNRRQPPCVYVPACGGCAWQAASESTQLEWKRRNLEEALRRIGGLDPEVLDIGPIISPRRWGARHRVQFRVDGEQRLGFYRHASNDLVQISSCLTADGTVNAHLPIARKWLAGTSTTIRRLEIATAVPGEAVLVANAEGPFRNDGAYHESFLTRHPSLRGLVLFGRGWRHSFGDPRVEVTVENDVTLETRGGFTQVNPEGNRQLVETALALGEPAAEERVLDLYCGSGNLTIPFARRVAEVTAVERDRTALADTRRNAVRLGIGGLRLVAGDARPVAANLAAEGVRFDLVVLDPPRSGAAEVLEAIGKLAPRRIVYVSCNPPTLARDLATLRAAGYHPGPIRPIDLFPQTWHLETVVRLDKTA